MLGRVRNTHLKVCHSIDEYVDFQGDCPYADIIDIKFGMLPESASFQQSFGILIIYKEPLKSCCGDPFCIGKCKEGESS